LTLQIVGDTFVSQRSLKYRPTLFFKLEKAMKPLMFTGLNGDRRRFIGGSDAGVIMGQDEKALVRLWKEKQGEVGPEDLSGNLIVQLGLVTEDLNPQWYERNTGNGIKDASLGSSTRSSGGRRPPSIRSPYFPSFFLTRSRSLTPGPPPFSSMNSTPAFSRTLLMFERVSGSPAYRPTSRLVTVLRCKPVASARSRTVQFKAARAIRTCALVTVI
jgi:hypothetical protein